MSSILRVGYPPYTGVLAHEYNDALRAVLQQTLVAEGFTPVYTLDCSGPVLDALNQPGIDVLLLDLDAPDTDSLALCREVRRLHAGLGLLAMSARADADRIAGVLDAGADQLLAKPVAAKELAAQIRRLHSRAMGIAGHAELNSRRNEE